MKVYARMQRFQDGGTAYAGLDPNDPRNAGFGSAPYTPPPTSTTPPPPAAPTYPNYSGAGDPKALQLSNQRDLLNSQQAQIGPSQAVLNAMGLVYNAQGQLVPVKQAALNAQGNVYNAVQGTFGPQGQYIDAQGNVIDARAAQNAGSRAYIGQSAQANADRTAAEQRIQAAHANTADQAAVGQAQDYENWTDYQYRLAGGAPPVDVVNRSGGPLPMGTRTKLETQEQVVTDEEKQKENLRALQLEGARLVVQLLGTNVEAAQEEAARIGLTVDQAQLLVKEAENAANLANLDVKQGELNIEPLSNAADLARLAQSQSQLDTRALGIQNDISELPPASGLTVYTNPFTGQSSYMTEAQALTQRAEDAKSLPGGASKTASLTPSEVGYTKLTESQILALYKRGVLGEHGREIAVSTLMLKGYSAIVAEKLVADVDLEMAKSAGGTSGGAAITFGPGD